ncbi:MAG TPA: hypothetical protein VL475_11230 [Planctomycetaceae bacterium]|nr:hypothetical protein [Planctomycetaceae bacterium]
MPRPSQLPDLPLMLAEIPRPVADLLRATGLPVETLPRVTLLATGSGRFVLYDSRNSVSVVQSRGAASQGLIPLDLRALSDEPDWPESTNSPLELASSAAVRTFLERLKLEMEQRGGIWLRISDYPFPFQSAIAIAVDHLSEVPHGFATVAQALPGKVTHFVSSRLRGAALARLIAAAPFDLGWRIVPEDCEISRRRTIAHWRTRLERFRGAGLAPRGLFLSHPELTLPSTRTLTAQGWEYSCQPGPVSSCHVEPGRRSLAIPPWVRLRSVLLPAREAFVEYVGEHYQSGCPLFLTASTDRLQLAQDLVTVANDAARCSLMWHTSFGDFACWRRLRRLMRLQVWRRDAGCEIHANGEFGDSMWGLEIWRGDHLAAIPFHTSELYVPDDGLVYLHAMKRTPGGCALLNPSMRQLLSPNDANQPLAA